MYVREGATEFIVSWGGIWAYAGSAPHADLLLQYPV
jgi:hypothetical protein